MLALAAAPLCASAHQPAEFTLWARRAFHPLTPCCTGRGLWAEENVLSHRDQTKNFPVGNELGILKWRIPAPSTLPVTVSCWPSAVGNNATVNLEYESESAMTISGLYVSVPCNSTPNITDIGEGDARYNAKKGMVEWKVDLIDGSNRNGSLEFTVPDTDVDSFFPITVSFTAEGTMSGIKVMSPSSPPRVLCVVYCRMFLFLADVGVSYGRRRQRELTYRLPPRSRASLTRGLRRLLPFPRRLTSRWRSMRLAASKCPWAPDPWLG